MARKCHSFFIHMQVGTCKEGDNMVYFIAAICKDSDNIEYRDYIHQVKPIVEE